MKRLWRPALAWAAYGSTVALAAFVPASFDAACISACVLGCVAIGTTIHAAGVAA